MEDDLLNALSSEVFGTGVIGDLSDLSRDNILNLTELLPRLGEGGGEAQFNEELADGRDEDDRGEEEAASTFSGEQLADGLNEIDVDSSDLLSEVGEVDGFGSEGVASGDEAGTDGGERSANDSGSDDEYLPEGDEAGEYGDEASSDDDGSELPNLDGLSAYEIQRAMNIVANQKALEAMNLPKTKGQRKRKAKRSGKTAPKVPALSTRTTNRGLSLVVKLDGATELGRHKLSAHPAPAVEAQQALLDRDEAKISKSEQSRRKKRQRQEEKEEARANKAALRKGRGRKRRGADGDERGPSKEGASVRLGKKQKRQSVSCPLCAAPLLMTLDRSLRESLGGVKPLGGRGSTFLVSDVIAYGGVVPKGTKTAWGAPREVEKIQKYCYECTRTSQHPSGEAYKWRQWPPAFIEEHGIDPDVIEEGGEALLPSASALPPIPPSEDIPMPPQLPQTGGA